MTMFSAYAQGPNISHVMGNNIISGGETCYKVPLANAPKILESFKYFNTPECCYMEITKFKTSASFGIVSNIVSIDGEDLAPVPPANNGEATLYVSKKGESPNDAYFVIDKWRDNDKELLRIFVLSYGYTKQQELILVLNITIENGQNIKQIKESIAFENMMKYGEYVIKNINVGCN